MRRATAALDFYSPVLQPKAAGRVRVAVKSLRRLLGDLRDLDVLLVNSLEWSGLIAPEALATWVYESAHRRFDCETALRDRWKRGRFQQHLSTIASPPRLIATVRPGKSDPSWCQLITHSLAQAIASLEAPMGLSPWDPAAIHRSRIACKSLRYQMELFPEPMGPWLNLRSCGKAAQEKLGRIHDAVVLIERVQQDLSLWRLFSCPVMQSILWHERERLQEQLTKFQSWWDQVQLPSQMRQILRCPAARAETK
jgi:CHAD domain-containing protein